MTKKKKTDWMILVEQLRKKYPNKSLKEILMMAKPMYRKHKQTDDLSWVDTAEKEQRRGMRRHKREWRDIS